MIKDRFVLIDAFALIYRAFYGMPSGLTYQEKPVGAAYGFTSALLSAIKTLHPEYLAVGMDKGKSHRIKEFDKYKIHRKPTPDDLKAQIPICVDILDAMDIPTFAVEGFEGEDIIATIVAKIRNPKSEIRNKYQIQNDDQKQNKIKKNTNNFEFRASCFEFIIVTGDMDLIQLVDEDTKIYSMARGVNQAVLYDTAKVKERYGLSPLQFVDYKALRGDPSDNIPGVPGIGEKGAISLINKYGSLENIYQTISNDKFQMSNKIRNPKSEIRNNNNEEKINNNTNISEKILKILIENKEQAFLSQKLAKICADAPLDFNINNAKIHEFDKEKTIALFQKYGFRSLISRLPEDSEESRIKNQESRILNKENKNTENQQKLF